jgi:hypothetical protein
MEQRLHVAHSDVALWEQGKRVPKVSDLAAYLIHLSVPKATLHFILSLREHAHHHTWTAPGTRHEGQHAAGIEACASAARTITHAAYGYIPDTLHTSDYAHVLGAQPANPWDSENNQHSAHPQRLQILLSETALRTTVGDIRVMRRQWRHLATLITDDEHVDIRIIPTAAEAALRRVGELTLYEFRLGVDIAHIEHPHHGVFHTDPDTVRAIRSAIGHLVVDDALSISDSLLFLENLYSGHLFDARTAPVKGGPAKELLLSHR